MKPFGVLFYESRTRRQQIMDWFRRRLGREQVSTFIYFGDQPDEGTFMTLVWDASGILRIEDEEPKS